MEGDPIDAVITWVDGSDQKHLKKREFYISDTLKGSDKSGKVKWRFIDAGEVKFCIFSIRKFAPWIRDIFLVTDEQKPSWLSPELQKQLKIHIIDHKIIFRDHQDSLPCFNSIAITSLLWRIPNLSNKYILFNDDIFLIKETSREDFFRGDKIVLRGQFKNQKIGLLTFIRRVIKKFVFIQKGIRLDIIRSKTHSNAVKLINDSKKYFETVHAPLGYRKDLQEAFYKLKPGVLDFNVSFKFRNNRQYLSSVLNNHLALEKNMAIILDGSDAELIIPKVGGIRDQRIKFEALVESNHKKKFLCFQDMAFLKQENPGEFLEVTEYLSRTILS